MSVGQYGHRDRMNTRPFLGTEALAAGTVTRRTLASRHNAVYRNVYIPKGEELTPLTRAMAAWLWSGRQATAAGLSAAALYGTRWIDAGLPAELYRRNGKPVDGIIIHRDELRDDEICIAEGIARRRPRGRRLTSDGARAVTGQSSGWTHGAGDRLAGGRRRAAG